MCTDQILIPIPAWGDSSRFDASHPEYGLNSEGQQCWQIDACIAPALLAVWVAGYKTLGCCCGHGGPGVISLDLGDAPAAEHHCSKCGLLHSC